MEHADLQQRRRSPAWVRAMSDQQLHGLGGKLCREERYGGISQRQGQLLDAVISELEYRTRRDLRGGMRSCSCELCMSPFVEEEPEFHQAHYEGAQLSLAALEG